MLGEHAIGKEHVQEVLLGLQRSREGLARSSAAERASVLARAAEIWARPSSSARERIASQVSTGLGFSEPVVHAGLERLFSAIREDELCAWWGRTHRSPSPGLVAVISAGNIPGVAIFPMAASLLAGAPVLVKASSREPFLAAAWQETLEDVSPDLGRACAVLHWSAEEGRIESLALESADKILVFGRDDTVERFRIAFPGRTVGFGTGVSLAIIGERKAHDRAAASALALDVAIWDQQGCLSPHGAYVLGDYRTAVAFAGLLAEALSSVEADLPRGRLSPAEAAAIRNFRAGAEARKAAGEEILLLTPNETSRSASRPEAAVMSPMSWTVLSANEDSFELSCLNRTVWVKPLGRIADLDRLLEAWRPYLQSAGVSLDASERAPAEAALRRSGVGHIVPLGTMQAPRIDWRNKGLDLLTALLGDSPPVRQAS